MIADLHALTAQPSAHQLRQDILETARMMLAIAPEATIFRQSDIPAHGELAFILSAHTTASEMAGMIQFKEKSRAGYSPSMALMSYPILMAADILLYQPDQLLIGADQAEHMELTRRLSRKLNTQGCSLKMPEARPQHRIKDLRHPLLKMSKSAPSDSGRINLMDSPEAIRHKIRKAKTDEAGLANLRLIYTLITGEPAPESPNAELKTLLSEAIIRALTPIQRRYEALSEPDIYQGLSRGAAKARETAQQTLDNIKESLGFRLPRTL